MGCDIHLYIEYNRYGHYECFGGQIPLTRIYPMFGLMARVRWRDFDETIEPRGLPENISNDVFDAFYLEVNDKEHEKIMQLNVGTVRGFCTVKDAEKWRGVIFEKNKHTYTPDPDWHTPSWLSAFEFSRLIEAYDRWVDDLVDSKPGADISDYRAVLAAVRALPGGRIVFWFDN